MKLLILASVYPNSGHPTSGMLEERSVIALKDHTEHIEVLAPRPYIPKLLAFKPRWKVYAQIANEELRKGIVVHRPPLFVIPGFGYSLLKDRVAFLSSRKKAKILHSHVKFDAIISFNLLTSGGLAWRLGKYLGIPACGWATGSDVRVPATSSAGKIVSRSIKNLNFIFYQSSELLDVASGLVSDNHPDKLSDRQTVLSRGIPVPTSLPSIEARKKIRATWGVSDNEIVVLSLGRILKEKGIFELEEAISNASLLDQRIVCVLVGSIPSFDETDKILKKLEYNSHLKSRFKIYPACNPDDIWNVLNGADIFAFTSYKEGMPNSLLEAMSSGLPAIAFSIPPIEEMDRGTNSLIKVQPFKSDLFTKALLQLADSPENRKTIGEKGRAHVLEHYDINKSMFRVTEYVRMLTNN